MLIANLTELISSGTSGLSRDLVELATAVSSAELRHENALMRIYVKLAARTTAGTKMVPKRAAQEHIIILMTNPSKAWKAISVFASLMRDAIVLETLSPMTTHAARGSPSLRTSATTPI